MIRVDIVMVINRAAEDVWRFLTDPAAAVMWMSGLSGVSWISHGGGVGARFVKRQRFGGLGTDMLYETTAYEPDKRLGYKTVSGTLSGPLSYEASITLVFIGRETAGSATKLIYNGRGTLRGFLRLSEPMFGWWARKRFERDFRRLKVLVEAQSVGHGEFTERRDHVGVTSGG